MAATIADIAVKVGKSRQLVSAVLNGGRSGCKASPATQELVRRAAAELGYRPNAAARAVSTGRFEAVGLLLSTVVWKSSLRIETLMAIAGALAERDLRLTVCGFEDATLSDGGSLPASLRRTHADGFLVCYDTEIPPAMRTLLEELQAPVVWINSLHPANCVVPDERQGARLATEHLLALGHRRIAYLDQFPRDPANHFSSAAKAEGYREAMAAAGCAPRLACERMIPFEERPAQAAALLRGDQRPTAVLTADSDDAGTVLFAATAAGLVVPRDLSLAVVAQAMPWFDGRSCTAAVRPLEAVGRAAVAMLGRRMAAPRKRQAAELLPFTLATGTTTSHPSTAHP